MESKPKFQIGDRVVVTRTKPTGEYPTCTKEMCRYAEQEFTVVAINSAGTYVLDGLRFYWHADWLEHARCEMI